MGLGANIEEYSNANTIKHLASLMTWAREGIVVAQNG